ncbi:hypothetical protein J6590_041555 [Homalodisca vitripennis]|nr:hypothetical protein J6590_041555 [Homalodisca vitripennis]
MQYWHNEECGRAPEETGKRQEECDVATSSNVVTANRQRRTAWGTRLWVTKIAFHRSSNTPSSDSRAVHQIHIQYNVF